MEVGEFVGSVVEAQPVLGRISRSGCQILVKKLFHRNGLVLLLPPVDPLKGNVIEVWASDPMLTAVPLEQGDCPISIDGFSRLEDANRGSQITLLIFESADEFLGSFQRGEEFPLPLSGAAQRAGDLNLVASSFVFCREKFWMWHLCFLPGP